MGELIQMFGNKPTEAETEAAVKLDEAANKALLENICEEIDFQALMIRDYINVTPDNIFTAEQVKIIRKIYGFSNILRKHIRKLDAATKKIMINRERGWPL